MRADPVPHFLAKRLQRLGRADHDLGFDHFASLVEFDEVDALELPFADIGAKFERDIVGTGHKGPAVAKSVISFSDNTADGFTMQDDIGKREMQTGSLAKNSGKNLGKNAKQDRLKQALRENLKRRKSQARGRGDPASTSSNADPVSPYDDSAKARDE